jgi:endonuclease/exonuclease/phosphatase family metal-dependent hydrolase
MPVLRRRLRALAILFVLAVAVVLVQPTAASAASVQLRVWDFNVCDQYGRSNADCQVTPAQRASAISSSITSFSPQVVTFQEMCRSTFDLVVGSLPPGWVSYFFSTFTTTDSRCQSVDHTWGIALLAQSAVLTNPGTTLLGTETSGEQRTFLCIDVTVTVGMRVCTTHLTSTSQAGAASQATTAANLVNQWVAANATVVVGGDFNLNVRQCSNTNVATGLGPWYSGTFGHGKVRCYSGTGSMYEADHYRVGGDGIYDEDTQGDSKVDYVFGNRQHVNTDFDGDATSSSMSDHDPLRGWLTVHD